MVTYKNRTIWTLIAADNVYLGYWETDWRTTNLVLMSPNQCHLHHLPSFYVP